MGSRRPFLATPAGLVLIGFLVIAGFFLVAEHAAHLFGILPWLLLAACPFSKPGDDRAVQLCTRLHAGDVRLSFFNGRRSSRWPCSRC
jgi:hypothetical protein